MKERTMNKEWTMKNEWTINELWKMKGGKPQEKYPQCLKKAPKIKIYWYIIVLLRSKNSCNKTVKEGFNGRENDGVSKSSDEVNMPLFTQTTQAKDVYMLITLLTIFSTSI